MIPDWLVILVGCQIGVWIGPFFRWLNRTVLGISLTDLWRYLREDQKKRLA